jgi:hypothetical protein
LKSLCIPQSIQALEENWYRWSSLSCVVFESGASLLTMIEKHEADLNFDFDIVIREWDGAMSFPGYSVSIIPSVDNSVRLLREHCNQK